MSNSVYDLLQCRLCAVEHQLSPGQLITARSIKSAVISADEIAAQYRAPLATVNSFLMATGHQRCDALRNLMPYLPDMVEGEVADQVFRYGIQFRNVGIQGFTVDGSDWWFRCIICTQIWKVTLQRGERQLHKYWQCPKGCNRR